MDDQQTGSAPSQSRAWPPISWPIIVAAVIAIIVAFVLGIGIGSAGEPATVPTPSPVVVRETVTVEVDPSEERVAELEAWEGELDGREAELDEREGELDEREGELDGREAELDALEEELTDLEDEIEAGTIPGDGIWTVGDQVQPGTYRAQGSGSRCYWARLRSLDGSDIISNHFGSANVTVNIHASDAAFETSGCGSWRRL